MTVRNLGPFNRLTHELLLDMLWKLSREDVQLLRSELGVAPARMSYAREVNARGLLSLLSYSERLFPRPDDWGESHAHVGSFVMPTELKAPVGECGLSPEVSRWLEQGAPPAYFGFGSMPVLDARATLAMSRSVARSLGLRAVIGAGWSALAPANEDDVLIVGPTDHEALFPRCAVAVHHGGSGTTYASLRAGVPTVVLSVFADQPFDPRRQVGLAAPTFLAGPRLRGRHSR